MRLDIAIYKISTIRLQCYHIPGTLLSCVCLYPLNLSMLAVIIGHACSSFYFTCFKFIHISPFPLHKYPNLPEISN